MEFGNIFVTPSSFIIDAGKRSCIWNQDGVEELDRIPWANTITFRVHL
jgi:hypothetical protein